MADRKPWHDTVMHVVDAKDGPCGPYVPVGDFVEGPPMGSPRAVRCAACGHEPEPGSWTDEELAQIWWSAGAWAGHEEPPCFPRSQGPGTCLLLADNVEEARDLLRRAAALLAREAPWREMADRWECEDAARECDEHAAVLDECMEDHT